MADAVLPTLSVGLALVRVLAEPLVQVLQCHSTPRGAHERAVDELRVRLFLFTVRNVAGRAATAGWAVDGAALRAMAVLSGRDILRVVNSAREVIAR